MLTPGQKDIVGLLMQRATVKLQLGGGNRMAIVRKSGSTSSGELRYPQGLGSVSV
jgi:hypothetical protein